MHHSICSVCTCVGFGCIFEDIYYIGSGNAYMQLVSVEIMAKVIVSLGGNCFLSS